MLQAVFPVAASPSSWTVGRPLSAPALAIAASALGAAAPLRSGFDAALRNLAESMLADPVQRSTPAGSGAAAPAASRR